MRTKKYQIGFLGGGKMAEGLLCAIGRPDEMVVAEKVPARADELARRYGVAVTTDVAEVARAAKILFLSVRPQDVPAVAAAVKPLLKPTQTLVSIVAGKTLARLRRAFGPSVKLVRVMPNLAVRVHAGMCALCGAANTKKTDLAVIGRLLSAAGETVVLAEKDFDAVTALSGSGPAYFAYMAEAMVEGGIALGLKPEVARLLAGQTMFGTAAFLRESGLPLRPFIDGVCTTGGTTAAGMEKLAPSAFKEIVAATLAAAAARSKELAR
jgi:pyrroline-5-carboxylate reductase